MFELARGYVDEGMPAYVRLQEREFELEGRGVHGEQQREVGAGYFDAVAQTISGGESSTLALKGSTEEAQFESAKALLDDPECLGEPFAVGRVVQPAARS